MPNPSGANQGNPFTVTAPYGDIKRQSQLTRESPISGSPFAAHALETARRDKKRATRQQPTGTSSPQVQAMGNPTTQQPQGLPLAQAWGRIASLPGASDLVIQMANRAQSA